MKILSSTLSVKKKAVINNVRRINAYMGQLCCTICFGHATPSDTATVGASALLKKSFSSREFNYVGGPRVLFAIVNYIRHLTTTRPFFRMPYPLVLSYESLFHIIPIIHAVPLALVSLTARRALISGSLVGYSQKTFRKKFPRHFVEPPGQRTRIVSIFFFAYSFLSLILTPLSRRTGFLR